MKKKKIAIFTTSFLPTIGGLQYELKWLLDSMDRLIEDNEYKNIELFFYIPNKSGLIFCKFKNINVINVELLPFTKKIDIIKNCIRLKKVIKKTKPDLIHEQAVIPDGLLIFLRNKFSFQSKVKHIITSHGIDIAINKNFQYGIRLNKFNNFLTKIILKDIEFHIAISSPMMKFAMEAGSDRSKIIIIPDGLQPVDRNINQKFKKKLILKYNIKKNDFCLLSLSGMRPIKGLNYLIDEFERAYKENNKLKLFLACHGTITQQLKQKVKQANLEDAVHFIGFVAGEIKKCFFDIADCYINTAIFEPFGISLLEAMDYGKIVLASKYGGAIDFIKDRENGVLIDPLKPNNIKNNILRIVNNTKLQEKIKENAHEIVQKYYIDTIAKQYLNLYIKV